MTANFRIFFVTWNVGEVTPPPDFDFTSLLSLDNQALPDMYAVGMQELKSAARNYLMDAVYDDPWTLALTNCLGAKDYVRVESLRLVGIHLAVFVRRANLPYIANVEKAFTRTGAGGLWGSKGAVSVRMEVFGVSICIVNCHFTAHEQFYKERIEDYSNVVELQRFKATDCENILDHDYVFWIGDLNFRLEGLPNEEVRKRAVSRDFPYLWQFDQLNKAKQQELILIDFEEGPLNFPPTFKYDIGTHQYDTSAKNRVPSYCDRVLWHVHKDAFTEVELGAQLERYTSIDEYVTSDHKPVVAEFNVQHFCRDLDSTCGKKLEGMKQIELERFTPLDMLEFTCCRLGVDVGVLNHAPELPVMFEPCGNWYQLADNKVSYTVTSDLPVNTWDWIGLYKSDYQHFRDYVTWVWASVRGEDVTDGTFMHTVQFDAEYLRNLPPGGYYLAYFSSQKNCIVGYSDLLQLSSNEEDSSSSGDEEEDNQVDPDDDPEKSLLESEPKKEL